jgi:uncharacterized protein with GYD domain
MPRYLVYATYTAEGVAGILKKGGTARVEAVRHAIEGLGGKLHSFDFAFGADDAVVLVELPDNVAAAAVGLAVSASGLTTTRMTVLITPEEIDQAAKKTVAHTPPGG